jgi:hypothetical protein
VRLIINSQVSRSLLIMGRGYQELTYFEGTFEKQIGCMYSEGESTIHSALFLTLTSTHGHSRR